MSTARRLVILSILVLPLLLPAQARAGGWWTFIDLDRRYFAVGETVEAGTEVLFRSIAEAERARGDGGSFVYLVRGLDPAVVDDAMGTGEPGPDWWDLGTAEAIRIGTVRLSGIDGNLARATGIFTIPDDLATGPYQLMFCDAGCSHALADILPSQIHVTEDLLTAHLGARVDRLEGRVWQSRWTIRRLRQALENRPNRDEVASLEARIASLERLGAAPSHAPAPVAEPQVEPSPWVSNVGWFVAGACFAGLLASLAALRRRRGTGSDHPRTGPTLDEELAHLARSERVRVPPARQAADGSGRTGGRTGP